MVLNVFEEELFELVGAHEVKGYGPHSLVLLAHQHEHWPLPKYPAYRAWVATLEQSVFIEKDKLVELRIRRHNRGVPE